MTQHQQTNVSEPITVLRSQGTDKAKFMWQQVRVWRRKGLFYNNVLIQILVRSHDIHNEPTYLLFVDSVTLHLFSFEINQFSLYAVFQCHAHTAMQSMFVPGKHWISLQHAHRFRPLILFRVVAGRFMQNAVGYIPDTCYSTLLIKRIYKSDT